MNGAERIARERARQVAEEGYGAAHDDGHDDGLLLTVAACLIAQRPDVWGLTEKHANNRIRQLEIAGALVAAEIDRLLRGTP